MAGGDARELNGPFYALRRAERRTRLRSEWTAIFADRGRRANLLDDGCRGRGHGRTQGH